MRKVIDILVWLSVVVTIIAMVLTVLTTYQYIYIKYFSNYYAIQASLSFTMILWAIKFWLSENIHLKKLYSFICIIVAAISIFFRFVGVF